MSPVKTLSLVVKKPADPKKSWTVENNILKSKTFTKIVHPIFQECANLTDDPFWVEIFQKASMDKFPKKFIYQEKFLKFMKNKKIWSLEIVGQPEKDFRNAKEFFSVHGSIFSNKDIEDNDIMTASLSSCSVDDDIKKNRSLIDEAIHDYCEKVSPLNTESLFQMILGALLFGFLKMADLVFKKNALVEIKNLVCIDGIFEVDQNYIKQNLNKKKPVTKKEVKDVAEERWLKCLKTLKYN